MPYKVLIPFNWLGTRLKRQSIIGNSIENTKNFRALLDDGYIDALTNKSGEEYADKFYVACRHLTGRGRAYKPGDVIDMADGLWRTESRLMRLKHIRRATKSEVSRTSLRTGASDATTPSIIGEEAPLYKHKEWMRNMYSKHTATKIAQIAGCSVATITRWLKKHGIEMRNNGQHPDMSYNTNLTQKE